MGRLTRYVAIAGDVILIITVITVLAVITINITITIVIIGITFSGDR